MAKKPNRPTIDQLRNALALPETKSADRWQVFIDYGYYAPTLDELPVLRQALRHHDNLVVTSAAKGIGKWGLVSKEGIDEELIFDLHEAAARISPPFTLPGAYSDCLDALVSVEADPELIFDLVHSNFGHTNWCYFRDSANALKRLGSPKALSLLKRIVVFWWPELNKQAKKYVETHFPESIP